MCGERNLTYIDLFSAFATADNKLNLDYSIDGLRLNRKGYMRLKDMTAKYVNLDID